MYEKRLKGTTRWRRISEEEARAIIADDLIDVEDAMLSLDLGETVSALYAHVRRRTESVQPNLPGVGEGTGAYGRETP